MFNSLYTKVPLNYTAFDEDMLTDYFWTFFVVMNHELLCILLIMIIAYQIHHDM